MFDSAKPELDKMQKVKNQAIGLYECLEVEKAQFSEKESD